MTIEPLFSAAQIAAAVQRMAVELEAHYGNERPVKVLALMNGALWFAADLLRLLPPNFLLETVRVSSYGAGRETSGRLSWKSPAPYCEGQRVLVLDDVLDSGITLTAVRHELLRLGAAEVRTAVVVDKPSGRQEDCQADYVGFTAPGGFLVGYGMDANELYRNMPYIGVVRD